MKKIYSLIFVMIFLLSVSNAATKTWNGGTGTTLNWSTPTNWFPVGVPVAGDDIIFNTPGTLTFTTGHNASIAFNSLTISSGTVTIIGTGGSRTFTLGGNAGTDFTIASGASLTMSTNLSITLANSATADISGDFSVEAGRTYNTNGTSVVSTVSGNLANSGTVTCTSAAKLLFQNNATYTHSQNGGTIPTATWNSNSLCNITGVTNTVPGGSTQNFGDLTWDCAGQTGSVFLSTVNITGDLVIANTNGQEGRPTDGSAHTVGGNYTHSGGIIRWTRNSAGSITVTGDVSITGGECRLTNGNSIGTLDVGGNLSVTGSGILDETGSSSGSIVFNSGSHTYTSGGTISGTINWTVNSGATLNMADASTVVNGNSFTLASGGTLGITSASGIVTAPTASGNIQTTTRTFNAGGNYNYTGSAAQVTGSALPATINSLTINNSNGLSISNAVTLSSASAPLVLTDGIISGATITVSAAYTGAGGGGSASSHVSSTLNKIGNTSYEFPVGNGTVYRPIGISGITSSSTYSATYFQANPKTAYGTALGAGVNHIGVCEYWTLNRTAGTGSAFVQLNFGGSCNAGPVPYVNDPATLLVARWNGSQWVNEGNDGTATGTTVRSVAAVTSFSPFTMGSSSVLNPLPVKIGAIRAYEKGAGVQIDWTAFTEIDLEKYIIERSADGQHFAQIGDVVALNTATESRYGYYDPSPLAGINFYRLKNLDLDGKSGYSNIVRVDLNKDRKAMTVYPNPLPAGGTLSLSLSGFAKGNYRVLVLNGAGQQVYSQAFAHNGGAITQAIQLPASLKPGTYAIQLENEGVKLASKSFIKL